MMSTDDGPNAMLAVAQHLAPDGPVLADLSLRSVERARRTPDAEGWTELQRAFVKAYVETGGWKSEAYRLARRRTAPHLPLPTSSAVHSAVKQLVKIQRVSAAIRSIDETRGDGPRGRLGGPRGAASGRSTPDPKHPSQVQPKPPSAQISAPTDEHVQRALSIDPQTAGLMLAVLEAARKLVEHLSHQRGR